MRYRPGGMYKLKPGQYRITTLEVGQEYEYLNGLMSFTIEKIEGCVVYAKSPAGRDFLLYADPILLTSKAE